MPVYLWDIIPTPPTSELERLGDLHPVIARILWNRGVRSTAQVNEFLEPKYDEHLHDPFLFRQMAAVVERLTAAIRTHERIMIHGDYDADGVTSTTIMVDALRGLGAEVDWFVPDRFTEGYGLHRQSVEQFARDGYQLLIAIDCGTTNIAEVTAARQAGLDVIILDHHQPAATRPDAFMINPVMPEETYPFRGHSSAGVVFTVVRALLSATDRGASLGRPQPPGWEKWMLDLVAISTVADLMPLTGENRLLVRYGLQVLQKTRRPGLRALLSRIGAARNSITEQTIGFHIGPRLNAAGRLRHASAAVRLLLTSDPVEAERLVDELEQINQDRQRLTKAATDEAWEQITQFGLDQPGYALFAPHWSPGVLGLVAGRLADRLWKPIAVMTEIDGRTIGSARSVAGINLMAILPQARGLFDQFGGHPGASGFTLAENKRQDFQTWFVDQLRGAEARPADRPLKIDAAVSLADVNADLLGHIDRLSPFGIEHARPIFVIKNLYCVSKSLVGKDGQHVRFIASQNGTSVSMIGFRLAGSTVAVAPSERFDAVVEPSWNTWNGRTEIQYRVIDLRGQG